MRKLEAELGAALFERHARGVSLTEAGRLALGPARDAVLAADALADAVRENVRGERGRMRIGFVSSASYGLVPGIVARFRDRYPRIELSLKEMTGQEVLNGLEGEILDAGLVRGPMSPSGQVSIAPLSEEPFMLLVPPGHRLARRRKATLESLYDEPFLMYDRDHTPRMRAQLLQACEAAGFSPRVVEEAAHIHTIIALVESGLGLAFIPTVMRRVAEGRARCLPLTLGGHPLMTGFALATRRHETRASVHTLKGVAQDAANTILTDYR
jgi:DNA-binding transcriptional LysR family regulator